MGRLRLPLAAGAVRKLLQEIESSGEGEHVLAVGGAPELAGTLGAAFGLRALARELLDMLPVAGWALKGTFAYAGTRALGEAARARFSHGSTPPRASAERAEL